MFPSSDASTPALCRPFACTQHDGNDSAAITTFKPYCWKTNLLILDLRPCPLCQSRNRKGRRNGDLPERNLMLARASCVGRTRTIGDSSSNTPSAPSNRWASCAGSSRNQSHILFRHSARSANSSPQVPVQKRFERGGHIEAEFGTQSQRDAQSRLGALAQRFDGFFHGHERFANGIHVAGPQFGDAGVQNLRASPMPPSARPPGWRISWVASPATLAHECRKGPHSAIDSVRQPFWRACLQATGSENTSRAEPLGMAPKRVLGRSVPTQF